MYKLQRATVSAKHNQHNIVNLNCTNNDKRNTSFIQSLVSCLLINYYYYYY